jgi:hypothetical protein
MKKALIVLAIMALAVPALAVEDVSFTWTGPITVLAATASTGIGSEIDLGRQYDKFSCTAVVGGTQPTSATFGIVLAGKSGIYDSTGIEDSVTLLGATGTTKRWYTVNKSGRYIKGNYVSKVGGDGTTTVAIVCTAGY